MFFSGVFSMHITYIILALLYLFGYGSYALNSKSKADFLYVDASKNISPYTTSNHTTNTQKNYHTHKSKTSYLIDNETSRFVRIIKKIAHFKRTKIYHKSLLCKSIRLIQTPDLARPSPFFLNF